MPTVEEFDSLYATFRRTVVTGLCSPEKMAAVLESLRDPPPSIDFEKMSLRIDRTCKHLGVSEYMKWRGVLYVGEIYPLRMERTAPRQGTLDFLRSLGLPETLDVFQTDWRPPYWDDPEITTALSSLMDQGGIPWTGAGTPMDYQRIELYERGIYCVGQQLCAIRSDDPDAVRWDASQLDVLPCYRPDPRLHMGMIMPKDWQRPKKPPAEWDRFKAYVQRIVDNRALDLSVSSIGLTDATRLHLHRMNIHTVRQLTKKQKWEWTAIGEIAESFFPDDKEFQNPEDARNPRKHYEMRDLVLKTVTQALAIVGLTTDLGFELAFAERHNIRAT